MCSLPDSVCILCRSPGAYSRNTSGSVSSVGFNVSVDAPDAGARACGCGFVFAHGCWGAASLELSQRLHT
jgi:hypothetical protein